MSTIGSAPVQDCRGRALLRAVALACALLLTLSAVSGAPAADDDEAIEAFVELGRSSFEKHCATCHGLTARGGGPSAKALKTPPGDLTRIASKRGGSFPIDELAAFIDGRTLPLAHGSREMPIWGATFSRGFLGVETGDEVSRGRVLALLEYLRTLQRNP